MDSALIFRLAAAGFVAAALILAALQAKLPASAPPSAPRTMTEAPAQDDPLREAQRRCQALGAAGAQDAACLQTWAETRARFLDAGS